jgi:hypothetical protein
VWRILVVISVIAVAGCGSDAAKGTAGPDAGAPNEPGNEVVGGDGQGGSGAGAVPLSGTVSGLAGVGLVLRTTAGETITVTDDGTLSFSLPVALGAGAPVEVVSQPTSPRQTCSVQETGASVAVSCTTDRFTVGGEALGLSGSGLLLKTSWDETLAVTAAGAFRFAASLPDLGAYDVMIAAQPSKPRQQCVLERSSGGVLGANVTDIVVRCTTEAFHVSGTVSGLIGAGLELQLDGQDTITIAASGPARFAFTRAVPDGSSFAVRVSRQPTTPAQRCVVVRGVGTVDGDVTDVSVLCGALGGLRISEIGSCYYIDSACWVELHNAGDADEELSYYQLRAPGVYQQGTVPYVPSKLFSLPSVALRPGEYLVVRAKSSSALPDGAGVVHIAADGYLPWWSSSGFAELSSNGVTVDFVRFGGSIVEPTDSPAWDGGNAPAQPSSPSDYGRALARDKAQGDHDRTSDWTMRAFATPGGPNDVTTDADVDQDGVPDSAEVRGGRFAGLDMYAMGARLNQRDLFVEIDRMQSSEPAVIPRREALESVARAFAAHQIVVHFDVGDLYAPTFEPDRYNLGGGNVVPFASAVGIGPSAAGVADIYEYKAAHMVAARRSIFYYQLFGWSQKQDGSGGSSGVGERPGNDSIVTLGGYHLTTNSPVQRNLLINYQAVTMMHELGHNLSLRHGGGDDLNRKPNYVSVMNYLYSPLGLPTIGATEGDRFDYQIRCTISSLFQLTNSPTDASTSFVLDFSNGLSGDIDENALDERDGLGRPTSMSVDYNCNQRVDSPYTHDLNHDGKKSVLADYDDWSNLSLVFRRTFAGNEHGPSLFRWALPERDTHEDVLTDDVQPVLDEPCPMPTVRDA